MPYLLWLNKKNLNKIFVKFFFHPYHLKNVPQKFFFLHIPNIHILSLTLDIMVQWVLLAMPTISDGNSEIGAHVQSNLDCMICLMHFF